ncbi:uncharacterized protein LOC111402117 isoform X3 [Olea europaea var. sylvestris]|uniref:uncharacterized protein LOC111402117 isoform X3 n=1 Tax=Olea europaea var. sylvestris TaxID=158386 RepID=UPI000C1D266C|nr:uncharacterized protein LOC111402117 isoform X3 [Olea europaea var. sylvestris]XP_022885963.1 uncharacterized protein LOC111402117 isoform X3 [Olea europaea var. sylvestris]XP_022885964.1 uncharacterized protein LOC111402117 isoform X3 [Olea europaea var. sylvestris]
MQAVQCPRHGFRYNGTLCACDPGFFYNLSSNSCGLLAELGSAVEQNSGVDSESTLAFPETIFSFNSIKKFTQSQAVFLEATLAMLLFWLGFCLLLRLFPLGNDGRSPWFKIRWWISRLDISFATRHWLEDQQVVKKRKTELGGTFSIASWMLFIGLFAALLYQILSKRSVEVHNVRATNGPDLAAFLNDLEFNITTISSMSCAQLRGLGTLVTGNPGFIDYRVTSLSNFANYSCLNTTKGPTITLKCNNCQLTRDILYVSWQFIDLPNNPAAAIGFQFNLTAKSHADKKHLSFVSGTLKNASNFDDKPVTFRGAFPNILKFNLCPRIYHNLRDLKLIQPLFHEFLPGSSFSEINQLQTSLENSNDGFINTTLYVNFLSSYIVEIDDQNILGPVSFLADLGGLYCTCIGIFFFFLVQCEHRIKRLRNEDSIMRKIRNRRKAQERWEKLRKYVMFTWGSSSLDDKFGTEKNMACLPAVGMESFHPGGPSHRRRLSSRIDGVSLSRKVGVPDNVQTQEFKSCSTHHAPDLEPRKPCSRNEPAISIAFWDIPISSCGSRNLFVILGQSELACEFLGQQILVALWSVCTVVADACQIIFGWSNASRNLW